MRTYFAPPDAPLDVKFWARVDKSADCWTWIPRTGLKGPLRNQEYGQFHVGNCRYVRAHRFAYELTHGPIPPGLVVRHTCDNQKCVNPSHLLIGTQKDNAADRETRGRGRYPARDKTHCKHGHELTGWNLMVREKGHRQCRACLYACIDRRRAAKRSAA